jgi:hypothetical protein
MKVDTKFNINQEVFFINRHEERLEKRIVVGIKLEVWKLDGINQVTTIYRLDNHIWTSEYNLFSDEDVAADELLKYQKL